MISTPVALRRPSTASTSTAAAARRPPWCPRGRPARTARELLAVSRDGARAFFTTHARLTSGDGDAALDLYQASGGAVTLVSAGPGALAVNQDVVDDVRISANGSRVVFATAERLSVADTDSAVDLYERAGGVTTLVSAAPGRGNGPNDACVRFQGCAGLAVSSDGTRVVFETADSLTPADTDTAVDVYERSGGVVRLVSEGGNGGAPAFLDAASADGARVIFSTAERLVPADTDSAMDMYERAGSTTTLVSRGVQNGNGAGAGDSRRRVGRRVARRLLDRRGAGACRHRHGDRPLHARGRRHRAGVGRDGKRAGRLPGHVVGRRARLLPHHRAAGDCRHGLAGRRVRGRRELGATAGGSATRRRAARGGAARHAAPRRRGSGAVSCAAARGSRSEQDPLPAYRPSSAHGRGRVAAAPLP